MVPLHLLFIFVASFQPIVPSPVQDPGVSAEPSFEFVSGIVTELSSSRLVVSRDVTGKAPVTRAFLLTSETKIEGALRLQTRITVGFKTTEEGDVAVRVIVRQVPPSRRS